MSDQFDADGRRVFHPPNYLDADGVLTCPRCGCQQFEVYRTGHWRAGAKPRQRECRHCHKVIYTREVLDDDRNGGATGNNSK